MNAFNPSLYVVDDDEAVRRSLGMLMLAKGYPVQLFESGEAFLRDAPLQVYGCIVLDLRMPGLSGLQVFETLLAQQSPLVVIFLSGHGQIPIAIEAVQKGAFGWLEKPCHDDQLIARLQEGMQEAARRFEHQRVRMQALDLWNRLTPREKEVARHIADGKSSKEVARDLGTLEPRTVETHRAHIFAKTGFDSSVQLSHFLRDHSL
jgi:two-component system, LuxR family, response regulator TtrR